MGKIHKLKTSEGKMVFEEKDKELVKVCTVEEYEKKEKNKRKSKVKEEANKRIEEEKASIKRNESSTIIPEEVLPPVYKDGQPYFIIKGEYVAAKKAEIIFQELKIEKEKDKLLKLKAKAEAGTEEANKKNG